MAKSMVFWSNILLLLILGTFSFRLSEIGNINNAKKLASSLVMYKHSGFDPAQPSNKDVLTDLSLPRKEHILIFVCWILGRASCGCSAKEMLIGKTYKTRKQSRKSKMRSDIHPYFSPFSWKIIQRCTTSLFIPKQLINSQWKKCPKNQSYGLHGIT